MGFLDKTFWLHFYRHLVFSHVNIAPTSSWVGHESPVDTGIGYKMVYSLLFEFLISDLTISINHW